ncbi:MAG: hypothetical protein V4525_08245 [Pseudomonadota bacterium]
MTSFSQSVVTDLVRLPIFCDVAGSYKGTYAGGGTWSATVDPYTGLVGASIKASNNMTFTTGNVHKVKDSTVFSLNLPDGSAWRGKFILSKEAVQLSGNKVDFESVGTFEAKRETYPSNTCFSNQ